MEHTLRKEEKLTYKGGILNTRKGTLVLTSTDLYFETKKAVKLFTISIKDIISVNAKKGIGTGVDHLYITYQDEGKEKKVKIEHFGFISATTIGNLGRLSLYFSAWEQMINDARSNKLSTNSLDDMEKLFELKQKGVLTEEEFAAKKKQILGL